MDADSKYRLRFFEILTPRSIFDQIWAQKFNVVCFVWKLEHIVSQECWFWIHTYIFEILTPYFQSCLFCLKIDAHSISRMLIPNPDLDFWNFEPKICFWANLGPKFQSCPFCLKIGAHIISRMLLVPNADLDFWNFDPRIHFWANLGQKSQSCPF